MPSAPPAPQPAPQPRNWLPDLPLDGGTRQADQDNDGRIDITYYDVNRDGIEETARADTDFNGTFDSILIDWHPGHRYWRGRIFDATADGIMDSITYDFDGRPGADYQGFDPSGRGQFVWEPIDQSQMISREQAMAIAQQWQTNAARVWTAPDCVHSLNGCR